MFFVFCTAALEQTTEQINNAISNRVRFNLLLLKIPSVGGVARSARVEKMGTQNPVKSSLLQETQNWLPSSIEEGKAGPEGPAGWLRTQRSASIRRRYRLSNDAGSRRWQLRPLLVQRGEAIFILGHPAACTAAPRLSRGYAPP